METARIVIEEQFKFRDLLIAHDVKEFRRFIRKDQKKTKQFPPEVLAYNNEKLSDLMHFLKTKYPYLGVHFQQSRNHFRMKQLAVEGARKDFDNPALETYIKQFGAPPLCHGCKFFRTAPVGGKACLHLVADHHTPAIPTDIACGAWTPNEETHHDSTRAQVSQLPESPRGAPGA